MFLFFLIHSNKVYGSFGNVIIEILKVLTENVKKLHEIFNDFYGKVQQAFNEKILPALKETYTKLYGIFQQIYENTVQLLRNIFERIANSMKAFEEDFSKIGKALSETFKTFAQLFSKYFEILRKEVYDLYGVVSNNLKELPGYDYIKDKFSEVCFSFFFFFSSF